MKYPSEFSVEAQAAVEEEKLLADSEFEDKRSETELWDRKNLGNHIRHWVMRIVLAFAKEACKLGKDGTYTVAHIDETVGWFLRQTAVQAETEKPFKKNGDRLEDFAFTSMYNNRAIIASELHVFKSSLEWKEYQKLLLDVSRSQKRRDTRALKQSASAASRLRGFRERSAANPGTTCGVDEVVLTHY